MKKTKSIVMWDNRYNLWKCFTIFKMEKKNQTIESMEFYSISTENQRISNMKNKLDLKNKRKSIGEKKKFCELSHRQQHFGKWEKNTRQHEDCPMRIFFSCFQNSQSENKKIFNFIEFFLGLQMRSWSWLEVDGVESHFHALLWYLLS